MTRNIENHPHGALAGALVEAGLALLQEEGLQGVTLRRIAARAGVSHAAPAHHFDGLPGLLTAMAIRAHILFAACIDRAGGATDGFAGLVAVCTGYLEFAERHAGLFQLMFVEPAVRRGDPAFIEASDRSYSVLRSACLPFSASGDPDPEIELAVWSLVHGYAVLELEGGCLPGDIRPGPDFFRHILARALGRPASEGKRVRYTGDPTRES